MIGKVAVRLRAEALLGGPVPQGLERLRTELLENVRGVHERGFGVHGKEPHHPLFEEEVARVGQVEPSGTRPWAPALMARW